MISTRLTWQKTRKTGAVRSTTLAIKQHNKQKGYVYTPENQIAATDVTFSYTDGFWVGKCLICSGRLRFNAQTGCCATIEHIRPRSLGGACDLLNLGLAHPQCNNEKGHHWDPRRRHQHASEAYRALVDRLLNERQRRWRQPDALPE